MKDIRVDDESSVDSFKRGKDNMPKRQGTITSNKSGTGNRKRDIKGDSKMRNQQESAVGKGGAKKQVSK